MTLLSEGETQKNISVALIKEAQEGNTRAFEIIRDTIEEKPRENIKVSGEINNPFSGLSTEELRQLVKNDK